MPGNNLPGARRPDRGPGTAPAQPHHRPGGDLTTGPASDGDELHRRCVFQLALTCGHLVTVAVTGWYPVTVACCDRLGGTFWDGTYIPYAADVDFAGIVTEEYEDRPTGTPQAPARILARQPRTDQPHRTDDGRWVSTGRLPARVGAPAGPHRTTPHRGTRPQDPRHAHPEVTA